MSAHTKGPWRVFVDMKKDENLEAGEYIAGYNIESDSHEIIGCEGLEGWKDNAEADARLIAAAPDMLEVLQRIHAHGYTVMADHDMVKAVIAKATQP